MFDITLQKQLFHRLHTRMNLFTTKLTDSTKRFYHFMKAFWQLYFKNKNLVRICKTSNQNQCFDSPHYNTVRARQHAKRAHLTPPTQQPYAIACNDSVHGVAIEIVVQSLWARRCTVQARPTQTSVTRFGKISPLWPNFKSPTAIFGMVYLVFGKTFLPTLAFLCY